MRLVLVKGLNVDEFIRGDLLVEGVGELLGEVASDQLFLNVAVFELERFDKQTGSNVGINRCFTGKEPLLLQVDVVNHGHLNDVLGRGNRVEILFHVPVKQLLNFNNALPFVVSNQLVTRIAIERSVALEVLF